MRILAGSARALKTSASEAVSASETADAATGAQHATGVSMTVSSRANYGPSHQAISTVLDAEDNVHIHERQCIVVAVRAHSPDSLAWNSSVSFSERGVPRQQVRPQTSG